MDTLNEGAKMIAKFMDYTVSQIGTVEYFTNHDSGEIGKLTELPKSMDQLMIVFKKLRKLGWRVVIDDDKCKISKNGKVFKSHTVVTVNSCYLSILYFLDWYNANTTDAS